MSTASAARRRAKRRVPLAAASVRALARLGYAGLVVFHVWLLGLHVLDGQIFEPATAIRWVLAVLILGGFRALSRRGLPVLVGRRAVGLWLLVVVIHATAVWEGGSAVTLASAIPESVTALAQFSITSVVLWAALAALVARGVRRWAGGRPAFAVPNLVAGLPSTGFLIRFSPRPPPLA